MSIVLTVSTVTTMSLAIVACGSADEPTSATTTVAPSDTLATNANRRAKAIQVTGTKTDNDLLRSVEPGTD